MWILTRLLIDDVVPGMMRMGSVWTVMSQGVPGEIHWYATELAINTMWILYPPHRLQGKGCLLDFS